MSETLVVNEVYLSLQGESTFAGLPCVFVRLTACNLRCSYCDTAYAFTEGKKRELSEVRADVYCGWRSRISTPHQTQPFKLPLVELTGGEPLLQPNALVLMKQLCDDGFTVLVETSGRARHFEG
jgi:7-carboxy-7-deazaguanine synthase